MTVLAAPRSVTDVDAYIGQRLRQLRVNRGFSQQSLALAMGISFQQLQKYERATNRISGSRLLALARTLDCSVADFFTGIDHTPGAPLPDDPGLFALLVANPDARALLETFARIENPAERRKVSELVSIVANRD